MIELARNENYEAFKQWLDSMSRRRLALYAGAITAGVGLEAMGGAEDDWKMKLGGAVLIIGGAVLDPNARRNFDNTNDQAGQ
jgi:hypothetical protein